MRFATCALTDYETMDDDLNSPSDGPPKLPPITSILSDALDSSVLVITLAEIQYTQKTLGLPANIGIQLIQSNTARELGLYGDNDARLGYIIY